MNYVNQFEQKFNAEKLLTSEALRELLGAYVEEKFYDIEPYDALDLHTGSYLDYLMLPFLGENQIFSLSEFEKYCFNDLADRYSFHTTLNQIKIYEDVIELLMLIKRITENDYEWECNEQKNLQLCVSYFEQIRQMNALLIECKSLMIDLHSHKLSCLKSNGLVNENIEYTQHLLEKVQKFNQRVESKRALVKCMDLLFKHQSAFNKF